MARCALTSVEPGRRNAPESKTLTTFGLWRLSSSDVTYQLISAGQPLYMASRRAYLQSARPTGCSQRCLGGSSASNSRATRVPG
eukprot:1103767-Rhodomonas_salina.2